MSDLYGSDHYPIITKIAFGNNCKELIKPKPKFKLAAANWPKFNALLEKLLLLRPPSCNINKEAALIQKSFVSAAHHSISQMFHGGTQKLVV